MELLVFSSDTCGPCRALKNSISDNSLDIPYRIVDVTQQPDLARKYRISSLPTLVVVNIDGDPQAIHRGALPVMTLNDWIREVVA